VVYKNKAGEAGANMPEESSKPFPTVIEGRLEVVNGKVALRVCPWCKTEPRIMEARQHILDGSEWTYLQSFWEVICAGEEPVNGGKACEMVPSTGYCETLEEAVDTWNQVDGEEEIPGVTELLKESFSTAEELEAMEQLTTATWDGDLISKTFRDRMVEYGYAVRSSGWNVITPAGIRYLVEHNRLKA